MDELEAELTAELTFKTTRQGFEQPMKLPLTRALVFGAERTTVDATSFAAIVIGPFEVKRFGLTLHDTLTVTRFGGGIGSFDAASGTLAIPITLRFKHSLPLVGSSDLTLTLTTGTAAAGPFNLTGAAVDAGQVPNPVTLVGAAAFAGGELDGVDCAMTIAGVVAPSPFP